MFLAWLDASLAERGEDLGADMTAGYNSELQTDGDGKLYVEGLAQEMDNGKSAAHIYRVPVMWPDASPYDGSEGRLCLTCGWGGEESHNAYGLGFSGEHFVFVSDRFLPPEERPAMFLGGELYVADRLGSKPSRLTGFEGIARVPFVHRSFRDGAPTVGWTQVTRDGKWRLLFAELIDLQAQPGRHTDCSYLDVGARFCLSAVSELRLESESENESLDAFARGRAWTEWHNPSPIGDWWAVSATYGGAMNIDTYVVSLSKGEARRITSSPENEEWISWDASGLGVLLQSGREHELVRRAFPRPLPPLFDNMMIGPLLIYAQIGRAVPWGSDVYYLDRHGESRLRKLISGVEQEFLAHPQRPAPNGRGARWSRAARRAAYRGRRTWAPPWARRFGTCAG